MEYFPSFNFMCPKMSDELYHFKERQLKKHTELVIFNAEKINFLGKTSKIFHGTNAGFFPLNLKFFSTYIKRAYLHK